MNPRDVLLKDEDLRKKAEAVVSADWFNQFVICCIAEIGMNNSNITAETLRGARLLCDTMLDLASPPEGAFSLPTSGLHDVAEPEQQQIQPT